MMMNLVLRIVVLLILSQMLHRAVTAQQCKGGGSEHSILGWKLQRHTYRTMMAKLGHECLFACRRDDRCQSFNFVNSLGMCEFNDRTKEATPEDFVPDPDRYYYRRDIKRVPLGSIPELPAETCKEIKASEGKAVSGKYWLSSIKPGMSVLVHCNMQTGDIDECTASSPVCDINAHCQNNEGSYRCSCKMGFTGDGKTCQDVDECTASSPVCDINAHCQNNEGSHRCSCKMGFTGDGKTCQASSNSCGEIKSKNSDASDGSYTLFMSSSTIQVYCDMTSSGQGWTLIARFSNNDTKNWMDDTGSWWYDKNSAFGSTTDPSSNTDMISLAFWLVSGNEIKITRSDDSEHIALLQTTVDCLGGQTYRSKITSYGNSRNGAVWASDKCLGNCTVQYGGQYQTTKGFKQAACSGEIQSANAIGFWCDWSTGDGAVMMIGGGGTNCQRADHGIAVTEAEAASFTETGQGERDFGDVADSGSQIDYSLNLWVR